MKYVSKRLSEITLSWDGECCKLCHFNQGLMVQIELCVSCSARFSSKVAVQCAVSSHCGCLIKCDLDISSALPSAWEKLRLYQCNQNSRLGGDVNRVKIKI